MSVRDTVDTSVQTAVLGQNGSSVELTADIHLVTV